MKRMLTVVVAALLFSSTVDSVATAQYANNAGITGGEVWRFDTGYLHEHPDVAHQLGHDPRLVDNPQFLATHPGFDSYLAAHPDIRAELQAHPDRFMTDEWRHEQWEHRPHPSTNAEGITGGEISRFDTGYLHEHPEVAHQLGHDPRLVDNPQFLATHPGFDSYLAAHPDIRAELQAHPDRFMTDEWRHEQWEHRPHPGPNAEGITGGEIWRFDTGYLHEHPEVAYQLGHDPRLVDNPQFLATHPGFDSYLAAHPDIRAELQTHPDRFMTEEWRLQHQ